MFINRLLAEERRLARMKSTHNIQKAADAGLSLADGLTTSVSDMDTPNSADLPCLEINNSFVEAGHAQEVNSTVTGVVSATYTTCETEDISVFCKAVEIKGTKNIAKSAGTEDRKILSELVNEEIKILKANEEGKIIPSSKLIDAEETTFNFIAVNTEQASKTLIPVNAQEVNITSELDDERETNNIVSMLNDSEHTHTMSMPVDDEETDTTVISVNDMVTDTTSVPVESRETDASSIPVEANVLVDAEEASASVSLEVEENI
jgi:hypothetical protein